jgi:glycosyltransferase involved in cell wall biosynthesis
MASLDILVHASITGEPFGQVITEAMAVGKPVIASRGGGVPEIIAHGETGLLTPMGDAQALADELISLIRDPAKARRLGAAGYEHVRRNFTAQQGARQVEGIYGKIIGKELFS